MLGKYVLRELHARGMLVQRSPEWFFDPALNAPPDGRDAGFIEDTAAGAAGSTPVRDAGSTEGSAAAAAESTQAARGKQIGALQRQLAAVRASDGAQGDPEVLTISVLAALCSRAVWVLPYCLFFSTN